MEINELLIMDEGNQGGKHELLYMHEEMKRNSMAYLMNPTFGSESLSSSHVTANDLIEGDSSYSEPLESTLSFVDDPFQNLATPS